MAWFSFCVGGFLKMALVVVRAVWHLAPSPAADFFFVLGRGPDSFFKPSGIHSPGGKLRINPRA